MKITKTIKILTFITVSILLFTCTSCGYFGFVDEDKCIEEAETYIKSQVYKEMGIVAESYKSEVLYKAKRDTMGHYVLVSVKFAIDDSEWLGSYCVKISYIGSSATCRNCTELLEADFDFKGRLEELKALFEM